MALIAMTALLVTGCGQDAGKGGSSRGSPAGQAAYKGLLPGKSGRQEVIAALGKPALEKTRDGDLCYFYPPDVKEEANWVRFDEKTGLVREIILNHHWRPKAEQPHLSDFVSRFGKPDFESKLSFHSPWSRVVRFDKAFVELIVQQGDDRVLVEGYVAPGRYPSFAVPKKNPYTM